MVNNIIELLESIDNKYPYNNSKCDEFIILLARAMNAGVSIFELRDALIRIYNIFTTSDKFNAILERLIETCYIIKEFKNGDKTLFDELKIRGFYSKKRKVVKSNG